MIRDIVKEAIEIRKVNDKDVAEHIGVTKSTMSLFLSGKTNLGQKKIEAIFEFLRIGLFVKK